TLVWWLSWATLCGSVLQVGAQVPQVMRLLGTLKPTLQLATPGLRETLINFTPVVSALGLFQLSSFVDQTIASFLPRGAVTDLNYASMIYQLPLSLFGVATAAAALPELARERAQGNHAALGSAVASAWERVVFYTVPSAVAFAAVGDYIVALLYQSG